MSRSPYASHHSHTIFHVEILHSVLTVVVCPKALVPCSTLLPSLCTTDVAFPPLLQLFSTLCSSSKLTVTHDCWQRVHFLRGFLHSQAQDFFSQKLLVMEDKAFTCVVGMWMWRTLQGFPQHLAQQESHPSVPQTGLGGTDKSITRAYGKNYIASFSLHSLRQKQSSHVVKWNAINIGHTTHGLGCVPP